MQSNDVDELDGGDGGGIDIDCGLCRSEPTATDTGVLGQLPVNNATQSMDYVYPTLKRLSALRFAHLSSSLHR